MGATPPPPTGVTRRTSLDDMLEQVGMESPSTGVMLEPKVMTPGEIQEQKMEAKAKEDIEKATAHNPYDDLAVQQKLLAEVQTLEAKIEDRVQLDALWKDMNSAVDAAGSRKAISVARCYPMKNRTPDILPYDENRVELPTTKDDYINASHIRHVAPHSPRFIGRF